MVSRLLPIALFLPLTPSLWAQCTSTQVQQCLTQCAPYQNLDKVRFNQCLNACEQPCNGQTCANFTGALFPKYYILGLVYAPSGCTSTSALKCSASTANYQATSSMGTKVSTEKSFKQSATVSTDFKVTGAVQLGATASGSYAVTSTDTTSETITKATGLGIAATGSKDGVDHSQDEFNLLINPAVAINNQCSQQAINWYMCLSGSSATEDLQTLPVAWLTNPSSMPLAVAQTFRALGFTNSDYQTILSADPFANAGVATTIDTLRFAPIASGSITTAIGSTPIANGPITIDPKRFLATTYSFPYEPPLQESQCNNGTCNCLAFSGVIKNELQTSTATASQIQYSAGLKEQLSAASGILSAGDSSSQTFTWTTSSTKDDTTDSSQSATATITCPSPSYQGPTLMAIYWDNLFGSFLFVPTAVTSPQIVILKQGTALDVSGKPLPGEAVTLSVAGKTYHTWTDKSGAYVFFRQASLGQLAAGTAGQLSIKGVGQTVTLGPAH